MTGRDDLAKEFPFASLTDPICGRFKVLLILNNAVYLIAGLKDDRSGRIRPDRAEEAVQPLPGVPQREGPQPTDQVER